MSEDTETIGMTGAIALILLIVLLALTGCAAKDVPKAEPVNPHEAATMAVSNCALAIKEIATSTAGDAASKVAAVGAIERLCGQGGAQFAFRPEPSLGATLWQAALQVADIGARWYGIKAQRDVGINQANQAAATQIASYGAFQNIASSGFASNAFIAGNIQSPAPNITLSGTGVIGSGQYNFTAPVTTTTTTNPTPRVCSVSSTGVLTCQGG